MSVLGLSNDTWTAISAAGTLVSAATSILGLGFVGYQVMLARRTGDFQTLQEFVRGITEREQGLNADDGKEQAFYELLNYLEIQAAAYHGGLFSRVTKRLAAEKIRDSIAVIELAPEWYQKFKSAESTPDTFEHLKRFTAENRFGINKTKKVMSGAEKLD